MVKTLKRPEIYTTKRGIAFLSAVARFKKDGGEFPEALGLLNHAFGMSGEGQIRSAKSLSGRAQSTQQNDGDKGPNLGAEKAVPVLPQSPSQVHGAGLQCGAEKAVDEKPVTVKKHTRAKRGAKAIKHVQETLKRSLFHTYMIPDGRSLNQVSWGECPTLATKYRNCSRVLMAIHRSGQPDDPTAKLDTIVSEDNLKDIIDGLERYNDIL